MEYLSFLRAVGGGHIGSQTAGERTERFYLMHHVDKHPTQKKFMFEVSEFFCVVLLFLIAPVFLKHF
jgi:hypothetical protein